MKDAALNSYGEIMCRKILIGGAWPYANGSLHIGHLAGLLPGDVLARYHRACGDDVIYVSGSDCYGTPVSIRARSECKSPEEISGHYHEQFRSCFEKLGFSYDVYGRSGYHLPDEIISTEYLTLEGRKISTSQNWAVWVKDIADRFQPDVIRYFLLANGPEKRDTDFSWQEFVKSVNGELLGAYGNFVNRSLVFLQKYFDAEVPDGQLEPTIQGELNVLCGKTGRLIEKGRFREALETVFEYIRSANKYFDAKAPWITRTENLPSCRNTLYTCVQLCANFAVLLSPFLPFSSETLAGWLGTGLDWRVWTVPAGRKLPPPQVLFERLPEAEL